MPTDRSYVHHRLDHGREYPFDGTDAWWNSDVRPEAPAEPLDWAVRAARGIVADLCDRGGIKHGFEDIEEDTRRDIIETMAAIIRAAAERS